MNTLTEDAMSDADIDNETLCPNVLVFNSNDPSGAGGVSADIMAGNSVGAHILSAMTGCYFKDTAEIMGYVSLESEAVSEQARVVLEDLTVHAFKVGFCGSPEALSVVAEVSADYADTPLIAYMPSLSWWDDDEIESYWEAFKDLILPQTTLLIGSFSTLSRWLLPDWSNSRAPSARELAKAAGELGVPYTLVTGVAPNPQTIENILSTPYNVILTDKTERLEAVFTGAGDTLSMVITAFVAHGMDIETATKEGLLYLSGSLECAYQPGMGQLVPDRLFWLHSGEAEDDFDSDEEHAAELDQIDDFGLPKITTRH